MKIGLFYPQQGYVLWKFCSIKDYPKLTYTNLFIVKYFSLQRQPPEKIEEKGAKKSSVTFQILNPTNKFSGASGQKEKLIYLKVPPFSRYPVPVLMFRFADTWYLVLFFLGLKLHSLKLEIDCMACPVWGVRAGSLKLLISLFPNYIMSMQCWILCGFFSRFPINYKNRTWWENLTNSFRVNF